MSGGCIRLPKNESETERMARVILGLFAWLVAFLLLTGTARYLAIIAGMILVMTGISGFCGIYYLLKINTRKKKPDEK